MTRSTIVALGVWLAATVFVGGVVGFLIAGSVLMGTIAGLAAGIGIPLWIELMAADTRIFQVRSQLRDEMARKQLWSGSRWSDGAGGW